MVRLASIFSWLFQPLLMPVYGTLIFVSLPYYAFTMLPEKLRDYLLLCNLLFTFLLPALMIIFLKRIRFIKSLTLDDRSDRLYPIFFTLLFYAANFYFLLRIQNYLPALYYFFLLAALVSLVITMLITTYWKISMHMTGLGGLCGAVILCSISWGIDVRMLLSGLFVIAGITGSSRLILNAHTLEQVGAGFLAGFLPQIGVLFVKGF